jgi:hypothetical protein
MTVLQWIVQFVHPTCAPGWTTRTAAFNSKNDNERTGARRASNGYAVYEPSRTVMCPNRNMRLMIVTTAIISGPVNSARNNFESYLRCM